MSDGNQYRTSARPNHAQRLLDAAETLRLMKPEYAVNAMDPVFENGSPAGVSVTIRLTYLAKCLEAFAEAAARDLDSDAKTPEGK